MTPNPPQCPYPRLPYCSPLFPTAGGLLRASFNHSVEDSHSCLHALSRRLDGAHALSRGLSRMPGPAPGAGPHMRVRARAHARPCTRTHARPARRGYRPQTGTLYTWPPGTTHACSQVSSHTTGPRGGSGSEVGGVEGEAGAPSLPSKPGMGAAGELGNYEGQGPDVWLGS
jgi:hypothetical protein